MKGQLSERDLVGDRCAGGLCTWAAHFAHIPPEISVSSWGHPIGAHRGLLTASSNHSAHGASRGAPFTAPSRDPKRTHPRKQPNFNRGSPGPASDYRATSMKRAPSLPSLLQPTLDRNHLHRGTIPPPALLFSRAQPFQLPATSLHFPFPSSKLPSSPNISFELCLHIFLFSQVVPKMQFPRLWTYPTFFLARFPPTRNP